ncbi:MAG: HEPN domain-containing protein [Patescibacteria group bacterium]|nr:HEPN domain-containing protein [Patescibacteria group bacterium]
MRKKDNLKLAEEWFQIAQSDWEYLQAGLKNGGPIYTALILAQQVVEKYLKGFLVSQKGVEPKRTHNIVRLLKQCAQYNPEFNKFVKVGRKLTTYYIKDRYPGGTEPIEYQEQDLPEVLEATEEIMKLVKSLVY